MGINNRQFGYYNLKVLPKCKLNQQSNIQIFHPHDFHHLSVTLYFPPLCSYYHSIVLNPKLMSTTIQYPICVFKVIIICPSVSKYSL